MGQNDIVEHDGRRLIGNTDIGHEFKGEKAVVKRVDSAKEEITVELYESIVPIPITVRGDNVRVVEKFSDR